MMGGEILRPQDIDQVIFLGQDSIRVMEFRLMYPHQGSLDYSSIIYGEPRFIGGIMKDERTANGIDSQRILNSTVTIRGKRTLVVLADLDAVDKNRSILDFALADLQRQLSDTREKRKYAESELMLLNQFMRERHMESTWEEWLQNKLELLRVARVKTTAKPEEGTPVSVEVGGEGKKEK